MSNETQNPYQSNQWPDAPQQYAVPPMPPQAPKKPSKLKRFGLPVGLLLLGLIIGGASGASAVPDPVEVVKEVPGPERVVEKRVEVPVTPAACLETITLAEQIITSSNTVSGALSDALKAAGNLDAAGISAQTPIIEAETKKVEAVAPKYKAAKTACRE